MKLLYTFSFDGSPTILAEISPGRFQGVLETPGSIFSIDSTGNFKVVYTFSQPSTAVAGLTPALNGQAYGGAGSVGSTSLAELFSVTANGQVTTYPYNGATQGVPNGVVQAPDNHLYTFFGVTGNPVPAFARLDYHGNPTTLYTFSPDQGLPGLPFLGKDGNFYGLSELNNYKEFGIYRLTRSGSFSWVAKFPAGYAAGNYGNALMEASNGKLYGTLSGGGTAQAGSIYEVTLDGHYRTLYQFPQRITGIPETLLEASDGWLYGTASGLSEGYPGYSSVFRLDPSNGHFETVFAIKNASLGECECYLIQGTDGKLYGVAIFGGTYSGGTVFVLDAGLPKPSPHVAVFEPKAGPVGQKVLLWGRNLLGATAVSFNGAAAADFVVGSSQGVWAEVPGGATSGPITVTTPNGSFTTTQSFTVN
jgi:hypothetical protein